MQNVVVLTYNFFREDFNLKLQSRVHVGISLFLKSGFLLITI
ncbi:hypothetical protein LEP1GSC045_0600 [Leptospira interrogans serovar Pomona str. Kennewicki LC82-25]|uniref:Uncharacterized protein n=1 Tax=Leptospira interrogans str. UI 12758 TaxID=1049938 RepID=A0A0E2D1K8_LEPIR|nr:hypothetical protein LEP1GSC045_0600 [Leptospira interrogans serovar Pomona str. Kennewicki LC82-25]EKN95514.1 hypothetical protein LEP1GSC014_0313 [Leptospira interrogans serovar Pomona str. Pomona]EKR53744.1 hypothetical protein LEP1GSC105_0359 [Leptospira interrogans str. UI 12758]EMF31314.1 hypothetical protein LEP1GSC201_0650 [Leptospira interrogans serovar Pomona str. Fox 32256]EMN52056.1 hypothetical protein LEP1GSC089_2645 [Leptospira interrogans serovar Autumnalis str. LP101]